MRNLNASKKHKANEDRPGTSEDWLDFPEPGFLVYYELSNQLTNINHNIGPDTPFTKETAVKEADDHEGAASIFESDGNTLYECDFSGNRIKPVYTRQQWEQDQDDEF